VTLKISLSLCISFFNSSFLPLFLYHVLHMGPLHVLTSKSNHLQDLATCIFGLVSSLLPTLYPGVSSLLFSLSFSVMEHTRKHILSLSVLNQQCLWLFDLIYFLLLISVFSYSQGTHSLRSSAALFELVHADGTPSRFQRKRSKRGGKCIGSLDVCRHDQGYR
jgi:hypothetical protein